MAQAWAWAQVWAQARALFDGACLWFSGAAAERGFCGTWIRGGLISVPFTRRSGRVRHSRRMHGVAQQCVVWRGWVYGVGLAY